MRVGLLMISGMIFVLAGCGDTSSQVQSNIETLEESSLQHELQSLIDYEIELQQDFETALSGEDLSNFSDASAAVFSNIDSRSGTLDALTEKMATYEEAQEELQNLSISEDEAEMEDVVDSMTESLESVNGTMQSFLPQYEEVLNQERDYFNSLGESGAGYETFKGGIEELNEQHEEINDFYHTLDEAITDLNTNKNQLREIINEEGDS